MNRVERLKHKLHPRTGFMIFFPGFILLCLLAMLLFSPRLQAGGGARGLALMFAVNAAVVCSLLWSDFGHDLRWNEENVYLRQYGGRPIMLRHRYLTMPFSNITGVRLSSPPRGVPPKYPLIHINGIALSGQPPLVIDPNFFTQISLRAFIQVLCERRPDLNQENGAVAINRLLTTLDR